MKMKREVIIILLTACLCAAFSPGISNRSSVLKRNYQPSRLIKTLHVLDPASTLIASTGVSAWSVTSIGADLAAQLFQASLAPYLAFLYFLSRPECKTPKGGLFGFAFLLVFVAATIPAGILAKVQYDDILANVDILHGPAEAFLTVTNLLVVRAFRGTVEGGRRLGSDIKLNSGTIASLGIVLAMVGMAHSEPSNALSFPTWMVHVSSIMEWLISMAYIWRYSAISGISQWKGLTWGMVPLHASGLCACTYHIFYNSPELAGLVALQAGLTCFGNTTMAFAAWRIYQGGLAAEMEPKVIPQDSVQVEDSDTVFYGRLLALTIAGAALVKWGELFVDFPFEPSYATAGLLIFGPTFFNIWKWYKRSEAGDDIVSELF